MYVLVYTDMYVIIHIGFGLPMFCLGLCIECATLSCPPWSYGLTPSLGIKVKPASQEDVGFVSAQEECARGLTCLWEVPSTYSLFWAPPPSLLSPAPPSQQTEEQK